MWMILVFRIKLSASCHDRFFPGNIGRHLWGIGLAVLNGLNDSSEGQGIIGCKFLGGPGFVGIDMRAVNRFGLNARAFDKELTVRGFRPCLQVLICETCTHKPQCSSIPPIRQAWDPRQYGLDSAMLIIRPMTLKSRQIQNVQIPQSEHVHAPNVVAGFSPRSQPAIRFLDS